MKKFIKGLTLIMMTSLVSCGSNQSREYSEAELRDMAAKMLMVGFKGDSVYAGCDAERYIKELKVGGIILFDVDLTGDATLGSRNITTKERLQTLTSKLREYASDYNLLIAADQEGGRVQRLKPQYSFEKYPSAKAIAQMNSDDSTRYYATKMAEELSLAGVNVNLAPILDIHRDDCPVIGKLERAYSSDPKEVAHITEIIVEEHEKHGVKCALKHFPGHGSAVSDSHYGLTDVTNTWSEDEILPFKTLIEDNKAPLIMTAHIFNRKLDENMPATLSKTILTDLLRDKLGYKGVILTDDIYMKGIIDNYSVEEAVITAINAGADMLVMGNNISTGFEANRPFVVADMIVKAVKEGKIPVSRLEESNERISTLFDK